MLYRRPFTQFFRLLSNGQTSGGDLSSKKYFYWSINWHLHLTFLHIHRRLQSGNHRLAKGLHSLLDQFSKPVFESIPLEGAEWPRRAAPACFRVGLVRGPREESLLPAFGETHRWQVFLSLSLRTTEKTADFPVSKPHHRHLQLLHSALPAHEGKKRQSPQTILLCVYVSPSDHRMEEVN